MNFNCNLLLYVNARLQNITVTWKIYKVDKFSNVLYMILKLLLFNIGQTQYIKGLLNLLIHQYSDHEKSDRQ